MQTQSESGSSGALLDGGTVVGDVQMVDLTAVRPNGWNPNRMSAEVYESLHYGLKTEGWIASQALLIWGSNEVGEKKNLIIDGEHRWTVARELGFRTGPMVFLAGLPEAKAKALTIALNNRRGQLDTELLQPLITELRAALAEPSLELALPDLDALSEAALASVPATVPAPGVPAPPVAAAPAPVPEASVQMVSLHLTEQTIGDFTAACRKLAGVYGTRTLTDTVAEALCRAASEAA